MAAQGPWLNEILFPRGKMSKLHKTTTGLARNSGQLFGVHRRKVVDLNCILNFVSPGCSPQTQC